MTMSTIRMISMTTLENKSYLPLSGEKLLATLGYDLEDKIFFALLVGSNPEGLSTSCSDLDILIVVDDNHLSVILENNGEYIKIDGRRADLFIMPSSQAISLIEQFSTRPETLGQRQMELVQKLVCGICILNENRRSAYINGITKERLSLAFYERSLHYADNQYYHFSGLYVDGRYLAAVDSFRIYLRLHIDALLYKKGETFPAVKWQVDKIDRTLGKKSFLYDELIGFLLTSTIDSEETIKHWIQRGMRLISKIQAVIFFGEELISDLAHTEPDPGEASTTMTDQLTYLYVKEGNFFIKDRHRMLAVQPMLAYTFIALSFKPSIAKLTAFLARILPDRAVGRAETEKLLSALSRNNIAY